MKELPYFKFYPQLWLSGEIVIAPPETQSVFINLCAIWWERDGDLDFNEEKIARFIRHDKDTVRLALGYLKDTLIIFENSGKVEIKFLREQFEEQLEIHTRKVEGGKKGANKKAFSKLRNMKDLKDTLRIPKNISKVTPDIKIEKEIKIKIEKEIDNEIYKEIIKKGVCFLFHRKDGTKWTDRENAQLAIILKRPGVELEFDEIRKLYESDYKYRRHDLITFLNNWSGELDRARNYRPENSPATNEPKPIKKVHCPI